MNTKKKNKFFQKKGFSLIELIISIAILAIVSSVGFINIINYKNRQTLVSNAREIVTILRNAQDRSLSQEGGSRWGVYFENPVEGVGFFELFQGSSYSSNAVSLKSSLASSVQFDIPLAGSSSTVVFSPVTGLPDKVLDIEISLIGKPSVSSTISVNSAGKISF
ncbi:prepilin-type N-terminal cleavage/methylation domain-containing protein [Candidatus Wolfebacteria bacterium]|nr:prepilin-type N-terminal cleavage/methylation domain-containing protein [Candidatus Wolfebacteria bacterium]